MPEQVETDTSVEEGMLTTEGTPQTQEELQGG